MRDVLDAKEAFEKCEELFEKYGMSEEDNPTTTSKVDILTVTRYAASLDPSQHQEAAHVTSLSDRRRRIFHSHL